MNGMHRVVKAWTLGHAEIQVVQFLKDPPPDRVIPCPRYSDPRELIRASAESQ
jgi:hypothetical protein